MLDTILDITGMKKKWPQNLKGIKKYFYSRENCKNNLYYRNWNYDNKFQVIWGSAKELQQQWQYFCLFEVLQLSAKKRSAVHDI